MILLRYPVLHSIDRHRSLMKPNRTKQHAPPTQVAPPPSSPSARSLRSVHSAGSQQQRVLTVSDSLRSLRSGNGACVWHVVCAINRRTGCKRLLHTADPPSYIHRLHFHTHNAAASSRRAGGDAPGPAGGPPAPFVAVAVVVAFGVGCGRPCGGEQPTAGVLCGAVM